MSSFVMDQSVGQNVGPYHILRPLGRGILSAVYEACQESTHQSCILTTFSIPEAFPAQARQRFFARFAQESAVLMKLHHPYILPVQDAGVHEGQPYLVNPTIKGSSVAKLLKQKGRLTPEQASELLKRIADCIDYAHSNGIVHGTLSPTNILLNDTVQIAGFGLMNMFTLRGLEDTVQQLQPAMRSIAGTTLGTQGYIAPEVIQGKSFDGRIDVYALGILLLELLSGSSPFSKTQSSATSTLQVPRLSTLCSELPTRLDAVIQQAVEPEPTQRIQSAGALATVFAQALNAQQPTAPQLTVTRKVVPDPQITLPNAVDWFVKEDTPTGKWQLIPPVTAHTAAIRVTNDSAKPPKNTSTDNDIESVDPFVWWSNMTASQVAAQTPGTFTNAPQRLSTSKKRMAAQRQSRRRVVAMLAGGSIVALGALGFGGITLAHVLQHPQSATTSTGQQSIATAAPTLAPTHTTGSGVQAKSTATATSRPTAQPTQALQPTPTPGSTVQSVPTTQPTVQPTIQPTQPPPTPTPPPPQHTGTVIGSTNMGTNSSQDFTNPANGSGSILIHLPNGNFVAYNKACTHQGVAVYYDGGSQKLKCPAHGAVFDPANGANPVSGPNNGPLQNVAIRVNGDGTITTG